MFSNRMQSFQRRGVPALLFVLFLSLYVATLSGTAFPGNSARLISSHLGLDPFPPMDMPVWGWLADLVANLPFGTGAAHRLNLFSAVCGAAVVALLYGVMVRMPSSFAAAPVTERKHIVSPARSIGALMASLYLGISLPFWTASNRAFPATWDMLLLLLSLYCLLRFRTSRRLSWALAGCFIFSTGMTGLGTMYAIAPFYGVVLLVYLVQNGLLRFRNVLVLAAAVLVGLTPYLLHAVGFMNTPAYEWRGFKGLGDVLFYMLRDEYHGFKFSVPKVGWAIIAVVSVVPWLIVLVFRLGQNRKIAPTSRLGGYVLNVVLTVIGILVALGISIDPWRHSGPQNPLVTPYLLIAMWFGGLVSFWFVELIHDEPGGKTARLPWRKPLGCVVLGVMFAATGVAAVRNFSGADGRGSRLAQVFVDETLDAMRGREWLVSGGILEDNIAIAAHERGQKLRLLSLGYANSSAYLKYVATLFEGPRLRGMAQVGLVPLLNEWFAADPAASDQVAIQAFADLWFASEHYPLPQRVVFVAQGREPGDAEQLLKAHQGTWAALLEAAEGTPGESAASAFNRGILAHAARVANNLGVYLEDRDRGDLAYTAYEEARRLNTNNLSATLNLYSLCKRAKKPEADRLEVELKEVVKKTDIRRAIWSLSYYYGFVRRPEAYAERGWAWVLSGKPNLGYRDMKEAVEMSGNQPGMQLAMARLYLTQEKPDDAERSYIEVLQKNPTNQVALVGLARTAAMKRQFDVARGYLQRLRDLQAPAVTIQMEEAAIASIQGDNAAALKILSGITKDHPEHWLAWTALALVASDADDKKTLEAALARLSQARDLPVNIRLSLAQLALKQNDRVAARKNFDAVLRVNPASVLALEALIRLDLQDRQREEAQRHVQRLLAIDSRNPFANYVLGSLQVFDGHYALAEASYRASLAARPGKRSAEVLNDLAWVLAKQGKLAEGLELATEASTLQPRNGNVWDTLGYIQLKLGQAEKAEQSLQKAAELMPEHPGVMLRIAEVYEARSMFKESLQLASQLMARQADLDPDTLDQLKNLVNRLRQRSDT